MPLPNTQTKTTIADFPLRKSSNRAIQRGFDLIFSLLVLIGLFWWIHIILAVLIKCTSKGPVIFRQIRIGKDSNSFRCYKYRTMVVDVDAASGEPPITEETDVRITLIGRILRQTNLDELPQFLNVLKGEMSVVGPRPHMLAEDDELRRHIPNYRDRLLVRPGITGWAAINGFRGGTKDMDHMRRRIELDAWYIRHWSFRLDIKIFLITAWRMLTLRTGGK